MRTHRFKLVDGAFRDSGDRACGPGATANSRPVSAAHPGIPLAARVGCGQWRRPRHRHSDPRAGYSISFWRPEFFSWRTIHES